MYQILHKSKIWVTQVILTRTIFQSKEHSNLTTKTSTFPRCSVTAPKWSQISRSIPTSSPLLTSFPKYKKASCSSSSNGSVKSYGVNSYRGLVKKYNEDRMSIILNIARPQNFTGGYWPKNLSIFGLFDGHSGNKCCDFLRDNFHLYLGL